MPDVAALMLTLFYPGGIAAAARHVVEVIRSITLGEYSRAVQIAPGEPAGDSSLRPDQWVLRTEIGGFGGNAAPGVFTGFITNGTLEETDLDGLKAVWIDGHALAWAVDDMTYEVGGLDLTLEEAKRIARSLR